VKKHVTHIFEKCEVSGRKELKELWSKKGSMD
jgi:DNA-binding CsgD family transcriptional regulator